jgi:hypothetical protein
MKLTDILVESTLPREVKAMNITKDMIDQYKDQGYVLCYSEDGLLMEFKFTTLKSYDVDKRWVYAVSAKEFETITKLSDNIKEMLELHRNKIDLYKKYVPAVLQKLTNKPE